MSLLTSSCKPFICLIVNHTLTAAELELVSDPEIMLTKNRIIRKVYDLFGHLAFNYKKLLAEGGLDHLASVNAKISKGENYNGLPYVMLDYPRLFSREEIFALRTFFWWGHFFSITLHLTGEYLQTYRGQLEKAILDDQLDGWFICASDDQWEHHFEPSNYEKLTKSHAPLLAERDFIKIAKKIPLQEWDHIIPFCVSEFQMLTRILSS